MRSDTFNTDGQEQFSKDYETTALLQKGFNAQIIDDLVAYILRVIPTAREIPIKILDLCCGDGGITHALLQKLQDAGIKVDKIVGYDISTEQIDVATQKYGNNPQLDFKVQDVAAMSDQETYDVVISLFGLHWLRDIDLVAKKIAQALKSNGKLMCFIPLEKTKFFALRQQIVKSSEWVSRFEHYDFLPFRSDPNDYRDAFAPLFECENATGISGMQTVEFDLERFKIFLSSWMQELRHLQNPVDKQRYLDALAAELPMKDGTSCNDAEKTPDKNSVSYHERFFWYHGEKQQDCCRKHTAPRCSSGYN